MSLKITHISVLLSKYMYASTVKSQKQAGNYYKPVSSISRYFLKKRYPTLLQDLDYKPGKFLKVFSISSACFCDFTVYTNKYVYVYNYQIYLLYYGRNLPENRSWYRYTYYTILVPYMSNVNQKIFISPIINFRDVYKNSIPQ